jgi:hypothetical protein
VKLVCVFLFSTGLLLVGTATAKFISAGGSSPILEGSDPILFMSFRQMLWGVGICELAVALVCFLSKRVGFRAGLVAWLATSFLIYRLGLMWTGWQRPCICLGNLTDALHIAPRTAELAMKIIMMYLLIGSYASLIWLWRQQQKVVDETLIA